MKRLLAVLALLASGAAFGQATETISTVTSTSTVTTNSTTDNTNTNTNTNTNINTTTENTTSTSTNTNTNVNTNTSTSTSTSDNTNTNINTNTSTSTSTNTNTNNNNNVSTSTATNNNNNVNVSTSTAVNKNENVNKSESTSQSNVKTENTNTNINRNENITKVEQEIKAPPASAIAPMISTYSQDVCVSGVSGAVQTQVIGMSAGKAVRDMNCERLKLSKTLYDMGMKVAAVSMMCQDERVFKAMEMAGTPCPYMGKIGKEATEQWQNNKQERPDSKKGWLQRMFGGSSVSKESEAEKTEDMPEADPAG